MANEWFCKIGGKELGPLSPQQLRALAVKGQLLPQHEIRRGKAGAWGRAGAVAGLFPKTDSSPAWADTAEIPVARVKRVPPPARVPAKRTPAVQQSEANPLDVLLTAPEPIFKPSGRSHKGSEAAAAHRQQQQQVLWRICGVGAIVLVVVGIIALFALTGNKEQPPAGGLDALLAKTKEAKSEPKTAATTEPKKTEEVKTAEKTAEKPKPKEEPKPKPEPAPEEVKWVDAAKETAVRGDVKARIVSLTLGKPRVVTPKGQSGVYRGDTLLMVSVELQNTGKKKIEYAGWGTAGAANKDIELVDNRKRPCARQVFSSYRPELQLTKATLEPGDTIEDLLVFQSPPRDERTDFLRLTLPAAAFGEKGTLNFKIPPDMIQAEKPPAPKAKPTDPDAKPPLVPDDGAGDGIGIPAKKPVELDPEAERDRIRRAHEEAMGEMEPPEGP